MSKDPTELKERVVQLRLRIEQLEQRSRSVGGEQAKQIRKELSLMKAVLADEISILLRLGMSLRGHITLRIGKLTFESDRIVSKIGLVEDELVEVEDALNGDLSWIGSSSGMDREQAELKKESFKLQSRLDDLNIQRFETSRLLDNAKSMLLQVNQEIKEYEREIVEKPGTDGA